MYPSNIVALYCSNFFLNSSWMISTPGCHLHSLGYYFQQMDEDRYFHQSRFLPFQCFFLDILLSVYSYWHSQLPFLASQENPLCFHCWCLHPFSVCFFVCLLQECSWLYFFFIHPYPCPNTKFTPAAIVLQLCLWNTAFCVCVNTIQIIFFVIFLLIFHVSLPFYPQCVC